MLNPWHLATTPDGKHARQLNPDKILAEAQAEVDADAELHIDTAISEIEGERAEAHRAELGFPPKGRWVNRPNWMSTITEGEPHPSFLAGATVTREE